MNCDRFNQMITAYVDGELAPDERAELEAHLETCEACRRERAETTALKEELDMMTFDAPSDKALQQYWRNTYNRLERGIGWILFSIGAILLLCYGGFRLVEQIVMDPTVSVLVRAGVVALVFGVVVLFVSLLRERLTVCRGDRYSKEIKR